MAALPCPILADAYLRQLERTPLIIVDEVSYLPFNAEAANLPALGRTPSRPSTPWHRPPHRPDVLREGRCALWAGVSFREAHVFFQLISSRYERASVIVTSNKPFTAWPKVRHLRGRDLR